MNKMQFQVKIHADRQKVWDTLWQDATLRKWAGIIDPGTYMVGDLVEGGEVQFISAENGYGVTSLVATVIPYEYLLLKHSADTQDSGTRNRKKEWTGGEESYRLAESNGTTTVIVECDVPTELQQYFSVHYPMALDKVKELAESH
jgi:uncharacterized protein YndB with AHSA1/START domain